MLFCCSFPAIFIVVLLGYRPAPVKVLTTVLLLLLLFIWLLVLIMTLVLKVGADGKTRW